MNWSRRSCIAFAAVIAMAGFIAWLGGYDFDDRNPWVAYYTAVAIFIAGVVAARVDAERPRK